MNYEVRRQLQTTDLDFIKDIVESTGFFNPDEVHIALELAKENLNKGEDKSGYFFNIYEIDGKPVAFTCFGKIWGTVDSFDLYWIVVHQAHRRKGIGIALMNLVAAYVAENNGGNLWIETASRALYEPTRQFYLNYGCEIMGELPDYYAPNDHKVTFRLKILRG